MEVRLIEQFESLPFTKLVTGSKTECYLRFPTYPTVMEGLNFFPITVEIKPKISGGEL